MQIVNVNKVKTNLSYYLNQVLKGKKVIIARRNIPIAEISPLNKRGAQRAIGQSEVKFEIPKTFFDPLPEEILTSFNNPK